MNYYSSVADLVKIFIRIQWLVFCEVELIFSAGVSYQTEDISERSEVTRYPPVTANLSKEWNWSKSSPHEDKHQTHTAGEKQNNFITFIAVFIFLVHSLKVDPSAGNHVSELLIINKAFEMSSVFYTWEWNMRSLGNDKWLRDSESLMGFMLH